MARLRSARLTNDTLLSAVDDGIAALESDIAAILGDGELALDENVTESPLGLSNAGLVTKALLRFANDFTDERAVYEVYNSTNDNYFRVGLVFEGDNYWLTLSPTANEHDITDTQTTFNGLAILLSGPAANEQASAVVGKLFSSTAQGLVPVGSGVATDFLSADGTFRPPGRPSECAFVAGATNSATTGTPIVPTFNADIFDQGDLHAANDDEFVIVTAGRYLCGWNFSVAGTIGGNGYVSTQLIRDRAATDTTWASVQQELVSNSDGGPESDFTGNYQGQTIVDCNAADKLSVSVNCTLDSGSDTYMIDGSFWVSRIA